MITCNTRVKLQKTAFCKTGSYNKPEVGGGFTESKRRILNWPILKKYIASAK